MKEFNQEMPQSPVRPIGASMTVSNFNVAPPSVRLHRAACSCLTCAAMT